MTLTLAVALNVILAAGVAAALTYVCCIPYRLDRFAPAKESWAGEERESSAYERAAA
jgi:uncharacterized membrane protein